MSIITIALLSLWALAPFTTCQTQTTRCESKATCGDCIREFGCSWCSAENATTRCASDSFNTWCPADKLTRPESALHILQDASLHSGKGAETVQIKPQKIRLSLRKGETYRVNFQYAQAKNYPIDLYYIMDLSASMKQHKNQLANLGGQLVDVMKNITSNFRMGFGSFVDKTDMPFVNLAPNQINNPCGSEKCIKAYSFINHLQLTDNYELFSDRVSAAQLSGNMDSPEGGLDALMQAIVCKTEIGWRSQARHLIVFSTDADFHMAGDGRLAGVVQPNDARCHLVDNSYVGDLIYDYPSISHINHVVKENNINIIFAIVKGEPRVVKAYEELQRNVENSGLGELTKDSTNVVELIFDNYKKIVESVRITDNASSSIEIKYNSDCKHPIENGCNDLPLDLTVNFTADIKALECLKNQAISIKPEGINEALLIELDVLCDCPCESPGHPDYISNSPICSNNGDLKCAVCSCKGGSYGNNCECTSDSSAITDDSQCKYNASEVELCSGASRGECKCGKCECKKRDNPNERIYGKYCECDNYSCKRINGLVCSGNDRGSCDCGVCRCLAGWEGQSCECPSSNTTCISPNGNGLICSGHGSCKCGECHCDVDDQRYYGAYCEECISCVGTRCNTLLPCVECRAYKSGDYDEDTCQVNCTHFNLELVDKIYEEDDDQVVKTCHMLDKAGCSITFQYLSDSKDGLEVKALNDRICPEPVDILAVVLYLVLGIVVVGLLTLILWKIFTTILDRREYARFEREKMATKFQTNENPLYKGATSTFTNPVYKP